MVVIVQDFIFRSFAHAVPPSRASSFGEDALDVYPQ
jgi:hypothetical protein